MVKKLERAKVASGAESEQRPGPLPVRRRQVRDAPLTEEPNGPAATTMDAEANASDKIGALASAFDFRDESAIRAFLAANADLLPLIDQLPAKVAAYLPADARLVLEIVEDPEDEDARPSLFALIPTRLGFKEARRRLDSLSRDWWLTAYRRTGGRLNLDVEYL
jgi:hypothetical protein